MKQTELNKLFKESQLGSIADVSTTPITVHYNLNDVKIMFESNPEANAIPVETDNGYELLYLNDIKSAHHSLFSDNSISKLVKRVSLSFKANDNVFQVVRTILSDSHAHREDVYIVYYKRSFFGLINFMDLMTYVNKLKELDENRAHDIQQFLIEKSHFHDLPFNVQTYNHMASSLGGDFYRIMKITDDLSLVSIFDVSGKGISGALSTISLSSYFALFSMNEIRQKSPDWIVQSINSYIYDQTPFGVFITAILMFVDLKSRSVRIYNLGHTEIMSYRMKEGEVRLKSIGPQLPPLGIDEELPEVSQCAIELELSSDRKIIFYSDGLSEATNDDGVMFGEERILNFFEENITRDNSEIVKDLQGEVESFMDDASLTDDITVLLTDFSPLDMPMTRSEEKFIDNIQFPFHRSFDYSLNLYLNESDQMVKHRLYYSSSQERFLIARMKDDNKVSGYLLTDEKAIYFEDGKSVETKGLDTTLFGTLLRPYHIKVDWFYKKFPLKEGKVQQNNEMIPLKHLLCRIDSDDSNVKSVDLLVSVTHRVPFRMIMSRENESSRMTSKKWLQFNGENFPKEFSISDSEHDQKRTKVYLNDYRLEQFDKELFQEENIASLNSIDL